MKNHTKKPKVSACIIVYNHEKYIRECLDNALAQIVNFDYEIIISEDCSTDSTREIIKEYAQRYPDKIKLYLNDKNLGLIGNWEKSLKSCKGEYIAVCEGDDYWTDPKKLQKQIDFLEQNSEYTMTTHNTIVVNEDSKPIRNACAPEGDISLKKLLEKGKTFNTCSIVFKQDVLNTLPDWFFKMHACDWTLPVFCAAAGKTKHIAQIMGAYRKQSKGAMFSSKIDAQKKGLSDFALPSKYTLEMIDNINKHFNYKYDKELRKQSTYWHYLYFKNYLSINDIKNAKKYAKKILKDVCFLNNWRNSWLTKKEFTRLLTIAFLPIFIIKIIKNKWKKFQTQKDIKRV